MYSFFLKVHTFLGEDQLEGSSTSRTLNDGDVRVRAPSNPRDPISDSNTLLMSLSGGEDFDDHPGSTRVLQTDTAWYGVEA